eukprot:TRINITY_DN724_c0_g2_i2.p1 TRINITY_DN724_c0_g2~~TRINITY_DN724_c0_g2_i2.p1  ORF type:complete len:545 (-),score=44.21 TRINITY_DN724_c0_g2_i2:67-1701(-)
MSKDLVWIIPLTLVAVPCMVAACPIVGLAYGTSKLGSHTKSTYQRNKNEMLRNMLENEFDAQMSKILKQLECNPNDAQALFSRGMISFLRGQRLMAISDLETCLDNGMKEPHVFYFVGMMYEQLFSDECHTISTRNQMSHNLGNQYIILDSGDESSSRDRFSDLESARKNFSQGTKLLKMEKNTSMKLPDCVTDNLSNLFRPYELYTAKAINLYNTWATQPTTKSLYLKKASKTMAKAMDLLEREAKSVNKKRAQTISSIFGVILYYEALYFHLQDSFTFSWEIIKLVLIASKDRHSPFHIFRDADFAWHYFFRLLLQVQPKKFVPVYPGFYPTPDFIPKLQQAYCCFNKPHNKSTVYHAIQIYTNYFLTLNDPLFSVNNNSEFKSKRGRRLGNFIEYRRFPYVVSHIEISLQGSFPLSNEELYIMHLCIELGKPNYSTIPKKVFWDFNKGCLEIYRRQHSLHYSLRRASQKFGSKKYSGTVTCTIKGKEWSCKVLARMTFYPEMRVVEENLHGMIQHLREPLRLSEFHDSHADFLSNKGYHPF